MLKLVELTTQPTGKVILCASRESILDTFLKRQPVDTVRYGTMLIDSIRRLKSSPQWDLQGESLSTQGGITRVRVTFIDNEVRFTR